MNNLRNIIKQNTATRPDTLTRRLWVSQSITGYWMNINMKTKIENSVALSRETTMLPRSPKLPAGATSEVYVQDYNIH